MDDATTYRRRLPHWRLDCSVYFVTWRLGFRQPDLNDAERQWVADALRFFNRRRYTLVAFVVMNDHVHVLVQPHEGVTLQELMRSWKGYTGRLLRRAGRLPPVWQHEYFDRIVRNELELLQKLHYIEDNPTRRFAIAGDNPWLWWDPSFFDE
jgi:REP element-mobilizing transposase RayT